MKTLILFFGMLLFISCAEKDDDPDPLTYKSWIDTFEVNEGDTLKLILGTFGDEEGAWVYMEPGHARVSEVFRDLSTSMVYYYYSPADGFSGKDSVGLVINTGSDGASPGVNDSITVYFQANP